MPYTANKKPGGLDAAVSLTGTNNIVVDQSGTVVRATLSQVESQMFAAKTALTPTNGDVVVVRRGSTIGQVNLENMLPTGSVTNAMLGGSIADSKLNTISTAGKVSNSATTATNANTASAIVARDASGNFAAGTITATLSGTATNATTLATGRTISLTGDVTGVSGSFDGSANVSAATTIASDAVTTAKISNSAITTAKVADDAVTFAKLQNSAAAGLSVIGRNTNTAGDFAEINAGTDGNVLRRSGTSLAFGQVVESGIADSAVTNAKIASGVDASKLTTGTLPVARIADSSLNISKLQWSAAAGLSVIGRNAASSGPFAEINAGLDHYVLRRNGTSLSFGYIGTNNIADNAVTLAKIQQSSVGGLVLLGRPNGSTGNYQEISATTNDRVLGRVSNAIQFTEVNTNMIRDGAITNAKVSTNTADRIDGSKITPDFGSQNISTDGLLTLSSDTQTSLVINAAGTTSSPSYLQFRKSRGTYGAPTAITTGDSIGSMVFYGYDGTQLSIGAQITAVSEGTIGADKVPTRIVVTTRDNSGGSTERLRITSGGNVGIGTSSPISKLHVEGTVYVGKAGSEGGELGFSNVEGTGAGAFIDVGPSNEFRFVNLQNTPLLFFTNNSERMKITGSGDVGIGTSNPAYKLDVSGNIRSSTAVYIGDTQIIGHRPGSRFEVPSGSYGNISDGTTYVFNADTATAANVRYWMAMVIQVLRHHGLIQP